MSQGYSAHCKIKKEPQRPLSTSLRSDAPGRQQGSKQDEGQEAREGAEVDDVNEKGCTEEAERAPTIQPFINPSIQP